MNIKIKHEKNFPYHNFDDVYILVPNLAGLGTIEFDVHYDKQHSQLQVTVICAKVSFTLG